MGSSSRRSPISGASFSRSIQRIIKAAEDPHKTLYWLAAETGMRAGELFGLRVEDLDLEGCVISVRQTVWRDVIQTPKTGLRGETRDALLVGRLLSCHSRRADSTGGLKPA
jgi:integrase